MHKLYRINQFNLVLCLFVIVWGAWVRRTHSGAGCGEHWPLCNGQVIPFSPSTNTMIEFIHRISSGLFGLLILYTLVLILRTPNIRKALKLFAGGALFFTFVEAFIGAVLVKQGLVLDNQSMARAMIIAVHLVNTFFLLSTLTGLCFFSHPQLQRSQFDFLPLPKKENLMFGILFLILVWLGASGAIAALGNTLFPVLNGLQALQEELSQQSHFLIQLRLYHPASAVFVVLLALSVLYFGFSQRQNDNRFLQARNISMGLFLSGLLIGLINLALHAPNTTALLHLLWADLIWISLCYLYLTVKTYPTVPND